MAPRAAVAGIGGKTGFVEVVAHLECPVEPQAVFAWVEGLDRYPNWLEIVPRAVADPPHRDDEGPAWTVDLRGRVGPLARSKRLRMVRTLHEPPSRVVFERREHDGRSHASWRLIAEVAPHSGGSVLTMHLLYDGRFAGRALERLLSEEIERSRVRLLSCLGDPVE